MFRRAEELSNCSNRSDRQRTSVRPEPSLRPREVAADWLAGHVPHSRGRNLLEGPTECPLSGGLRPGLYGRLEGT